MAERTIARDELVRQLGVTPRLVRELVRQLRPWLSAPDTGRFTALDLARLQIAARGRVEGRAGAEIEEQLRMTLRAGETVTPTAVLASDAARSAREAAAGSAPAAPAQVGGVVAVELARLHQALSDRTEREERDRDRMVMALLRTQQEVAHLREELGTYRSRRQRRRGFMRWLRG